MLGWVGRHLLEFAKEKKHGIIGCMYSAVPVVMILYGYSLIAGFPFLNVLKVTSTAGGLLFLFIWCCIKAAKHFNHDEWN